MTTLPPPGTGYFVRPPNRHATQDVSADAPGILLLPSPWGLTPGMKGKAEELADSGFTVLAPDLNDGFVATNEAEAHDALMQIDINVAASLVQSSMRLLQAACGDSSAPIGLLGYAAGGSWALWTSVRFADECRAVATYCGAQSIPFDDASASYLLHFAENDADVSSEDIVLLGLNLQLARCEFRVEHHAGVAAGFAEPDHPDFDGAAEAVAWRQTIEFFANTLLH